MKTVILCGGKGSRIRDVSEIVPKPMLTIGGRPILWHIMNIYAAQGFTDFVLALGYKGWMIREFFLNFQPMTSDCTIMLGRHSEIDFHKNIEESDWSVTLSDTGENTMTGGRVRRVWKYVKDDDYFGLTYGDGVADINIADLVRHHCKSGLAATLTAVRVAGRFGELRIEEGKVNRFEEKPAVTAGRINGGFMVLDTRKSRTYFEGSDDLVLEREPLFRMAADGQLGYFEHDGYWQCMDTPREYTLLNELWEQGRAPWKTWQENG